jgi:hypothetical protein
MSKLRKLIAWAAVLAAACGGSQPPPPTTPTTPPPAADTRTAIERRRDAACDLLAPVLTQCAVDGAKADLAAGKVSQEDFAKDVSPKFLQINSDKWISTCKVPMSTRQVRVLEVCHQQETQCDPLLACLDHLNDHPSQPAAPAPPAGP